MNLRDGPSNVDVLSLAGRAVPVGRRCLFTIVLLCSVIAITAFSPGAAPAKSEVTKRPETCVFWGTGTFTPSEPGFVTGISTGRGFCSTIGRIAVHGEQTQSLETGAYEGMFTTTAANGDTIFGTYSGSVTSTPNPRIFKSRHINANTGGTGRFTGATGTFTTRAISVVVSVDSKTGVTRTRFAGISVGP